MLVGFLPNDVIDTYLGREAIVVDDSGFLISRRGERLGALAPWLYLHSHALRKAAADQALYWEKDGHCTSAGQQIIAETLFAAMTRDSLVP